MKYRIVVIGAGVVGLTTAVRLQKEFKCTAEVTIYTSDKSPNTTGDVAAGLWSPYLLQDTPVDTTIKWAKDTQTYFLDLWRSGYAADAGISLQHMVNLTAEGTDMPTWTKIAIGCQKLQEDDLEIYRKEHQILYTGGFTFVSFICEPTKFLPFLEKHFIQNGGVVELKKVERFEQLKDYDLIVNCSGIYSRILVNDNRIKAIRGQVARVQAPWQFHVVMNDNDDGFYIIPNEKCVILGGTHQLDDEDLNPREADANRILDGCKAMIPSLHKANVIKHQVGLRPGRDQLRLELVQFNTEEKTIPIIHNYGHGGSGVTLCYGCAGEAVELAKLALTRSKL